MAEPKNNVMVLPMYIKVLMGFITLVGLAGGCMSIAGPVVGLTLNPNDLTAANFKQVERFGLTAALYFDCDKVDSAFGQRMVNQMVESMDGAAIANQTNSRTSTTDTFERLCNDRKGSHYFIAITSGAFTIVGMFVFAACVFMQKFEPDFVYIVPLFLSLVMIYDFVETNSSMFAYIKRCTEVAYYEDSEAMKLKNVIVWGPYPPTTPNTTEFGRYGVLEYGHTCDYTDEDALEKYGRNPATVDPANPAAAVPYTLPTFPPKGPCRPDLADDIILCTKFYHCGGKDQKECKDINIKENGIPKGGDSHTDDAINDLGNGLLIWIIGACFNVIANGMMLSALVIRRKHALYYYDEGPTVPKRRANPEMISAAAM
mmetsp:Transcript_17399/g.37848  ORF Transcript_17399/g.37848 Transcript_17399/m.37848 type:complete len:372 (-) Transcript_17399:376-1491(-)|eukprot:CAMPEP_0118932370 /NCGR_PEP_ID=MMETSP1169-20130426/10020_1 /TAXON_ID=36882 /ORGANISM="Pyramimonas obovata, Strain CCMP722" /LENGTH=371 /DNA_ID=CAMNT_0006875019 /DNA_START=69 /DNA_END=1184 /DNA_ORIENTATION=+